jgi:hypothetical protein
LGDYCGVGCGSHLPRLALDDARRLCPELCEVFEVLEAGVAILHLPQVKPIIHLIAPANSPSRWSNERELSHWGV